jgi:hypothetical protein
MTPIPEVPQDTSLEQHRFNAAVRDELQMRAGSGCLPDRYVSVAALLRVGVITQEQADELCQM